MFFGEIKKALTDSTFALEYQFLSKCGIHPDSLGEMAFTFSSAVNIGMIKEIDALLQGCVK
jgi:hypothetical protein